MEFPDITRNLVKEPGMMFCLFLPLFILSIGFASKHKIDLQFFIQTIKHTKVFWNNFVLLYVKYDV